MTADTLFRDQRVKAQALYGVGEFVLDTRTGECTSVARRELLASHKANMVMPPSSASAATSLSPDI